MKTQILEAIGEADLQPASRLNAALTANDRVKYAFSLLQMAVAHAEHPEQGASSLRREREACGVDDPDLDGAVSGARMVGSSCHMAGAERVIARIATDMRVMAAPVLATKPEGVGARLDRLLGIMAPPPGDLLDPEAVAAMTRAGHKNGEDSLHRLVIDLHKRLNAMQAELAEENLDGAAVYGLAETDRPLVQAFMGGLNRTAKLKFSHPGLATTATRAGDRLVIQNDIGTTDAHVIVIHVRDPIVSVTYTDIHPERLAFFQHLLLPRGATWEKDRTAVLAAGEPFYLATGRLPASDGEGCRANLAFLGSRLVFLIDWNRARKDLRTFLRGPDRTDLLRWAAEADIGHRGFLELGGARVINQAIEAAAGSAIRFGDRLCDVLGDAEAQGFLRFAFRAATEGLVAGQSQRLIRDRIRAALAHHFSNEERRLLGLAGEHAGLIFELAGTLRDGLQAASGSATKRLARAQRFERDGNRVVEDIRAAVRRRPDHAVFLPMLQTADDAADALEHAVGLLDLETLEGTPLDALQTLADLLVNASQEWIKALGDAARIGLAATEAETEDFLTATDSIAALARRAERATHALSAEAVKHARDFRQLHVFTALGGELAAAAHALKQAGMSLRDHMLEDVIDG